MRKFIHASIVTLFLCLVPLAANSEVLPSDDDDYLSGYISAILELELAIPRSNFNIDVTDRKVTISLSQEMENRQAEVMERLRTLDGIAGLNVNIVESRDLADTDPSLSEKFDEILGFTSTRLPFPYGDPFSALMADPKQPRFFVSVQNYKTPSEDFAAASVGYGETFGIYRRLGKKSNEGLQISISGGLFALFNLDAPSHDLINADYTIGLPITYRNGSTSARLRLYHQSSHLGDEYLLRAKPERINLSYESLELLVSEDLNNIRAYLGGEALLRRDPKDLKPLSIHAGLEYRGNDRILDAGQLIAALDLKSWEENDWYFNKSVRVGIELGNPDPSQRNAEFMLEYYEGYAPHGQFYDERISYYGAVIGISF